MRAKLTFLLLMLVIGAAPVRAADVLNIGIAGDPGPLDPARSGNFLDRNIFASLCDKLIDTDPEMRFVPQLATSWEWSPDGLALTLHLRAGVIVSRRHPLRCRGREGEYRARQDARHEPAQAGAAARLLRRGPRPAHREIASLGPRRAASRLPRRPLRHDAVAASPSPSLAMMSRRHPVCAGPFYLHGARRAGQDRARPLPRLLERQGDRSIDRIVFRPMPDSSVRLVNLQSGELQIVDQLAATDAAVVKADPRLRLAQHVRCGLSHLAVQPAITAARSQTPLGKDARVRKALEKAIDRKALNQAVFEGLFMPNNQSRVAEQPVSGTRITRVPERDRRGCAQRLLARSRRRASVSSRSAARRTPPLDAQIGEVVQAWRARPVSTSSSSSSRRTPGTQGRSRGRFRCSRSAHLVGAGRSGRQSLDLDGLQRALQFRRLLQPEDG